MHKNKFARYLDLALSTVVLGGIVYYVVKDYLEDRKFMRDNSLEYPKVSR